LGNKSKREKGWKRKRRQPMREEDSHKGISWKLSNHPPWLTGKWEEQEKCKRPRPRLLRSGSERSRD